VSDFTAFMLAGVDRIGRLVEYGPTAVIFTNPKERRTEDYLTVEVGAEVGPVASAERRYRAPRGPPTIRPRRGQPHAARG